VGVFVHIQVKEPLFLFLKYEFIFKYPLKMLKKLGQMLKKSVVNRKKASMVEKIFLKEQKHIHLLNQKHN